MRMNIRTLPRAVYYLLAAAMLTSMFVVYGMAKTAFAVDAFHGTSLSKNCTTPTFVGAAYTCGFSWINSSLVDTGGHPGVHRPHRCH